MNTFILLALGALFITEVQPQARFTRPVSRASAFRDPAYAQYDPPENYDDHRINCGNIIQESTDSTNCGVCGDPASMPTPRSYEIGGINYRGFFTGTYRMGAIIDVEAEIVFSKHGYMEWRLCISPFSGESQTCFNRFVLQKPDGSGSRVDVDEEGLYQAQLRLPQGVTCSHCVIQWSYLVANNWGMCPNGTGQIGCGPQELFRGCADVQIL